MALINRKSLKKYFQNGSFPKEVHFADLIDSMVNKVDDTISMSKEKGLELKSLNSEGNLLSFFRTGEQSRPAWQFTINPKVHEPSTLSIKKSTDETQLCLHPNGNTGILTDAPQMPLHVDGFSGSQGRIGVLAIGKVPADGKWHAILSDLSEPQALEVVAKAKGAKGRGKYALTHAIALATYGHSSNNKIKQTCTYFGWFWNKIKLRWKGDAQSYRLEIKSVGHYGLTTEEEPYPIRYHITSLWNEELMDRMIEDPIQKDALVNQNSKL